MKEFRTIPPVVLLLLSIILVLLMLILVVEGSDDVDYYQIMGISREASPQEIKKAFRRLSIRYSVPALDRIRSEEERNKRIEQYKAIGKAYEILSDEDKRRRYDQGIPISEEMESKSDLFSFLFGLDNKKTNEEL